VRTSSSAGLASGLIETGHELGAAFGVAVISAVASAASMFVGGNADRLATVAVIAGVIAAIALVAIPPVRPGAEVASSPNARSSR
jgi:putative Mn2+ efflux pump MntP